MNAPLEVKANVNANVNAKEIVIGIDVGGTSVKLGLVDRTGLLLATGIIPTKEDAKSLWTRVFDECERLLAGCRMKWEVVVGVGLGIPGLVDSKTGFVHLAPNLGWKNVALLPELTSAFPAPVKIENDSNLAALGEAWTGAGKGLESLVMITVGTGIGSGFIYGNRIYKGEGVATEMGHMVIDVNGPPCACGNVGCLEALAAAPALVRRMTELLKAGKKPGTKKLTVKEIFSRAGRGDRMALEAISVTAGYLGVGIANIINIFNPQAVIVGGGVSQGGEIFFQPMLAEVEKRALPPARQKVTILPAALGNEAGVVGGAGLFWLEVNA